jgi:hypothetical protein
MGDWLETPPGHHLMAWEQGLLDDAVANVFGYHALQLGLPELDALRANRMPHRWVGHTEPVVSACLTIRTNVWPKRCGCCDPKGAW